MSLIKEFEDMLHNYDFEASDEKIVTWNKLMRSSEFKSIIELFGDVCYETGYQEVE